MQISCQLAKKMFKHLTIISKKFTSCNFEEIAILDHDAIINFALQDPNDVRSKPYDIKAICKVGKIDNGINGPISKLRIRINDNVSKIARGIESIQNNFPGV